jgi:hypothetical protein
LKEELMVKGMNCATFREKSGASRTLRRVTIGACFSRGWRLSKLFVGLCGDDWDRRTCRDINPRKEPFKRPADPGRQFRRPGDQQASYIAS